MAQKEFRRIYFVGGERMAGYEFDNDIRYEAGPINVNICGYSKKILLTMHNEEFLFLWDHFFGVATHMWGLKSESIIKVDDLTYEIVLTFDIALMYLENNVIFSPMELTDSDDNDINESIS